MCFRSNLTHYNPSSSLLPTIRDYSRASSMLLRCARLHRILHHPAPKHSDFELVQELASHDVRISTADLPSFSRCAQFRDVMSRDDNLPLFLQMLRLQTQTCRSSRLIHVSAQIAGRVYWQLWHGLYAKIGNSINWICRLLHAFCYSSQLQSHHITIPKLSPREIQVDRLRFTYRDYT